MDEIRTASQNNSNNSTDRILELQQIPVRDDGTDLEYAFQKLKKSQFRYVLFVDQYNSMFNETGIEKAIKLEVAGDNNTWIFLEHLPKSFSAFKNSTNHHLFFKGTGVFNYAFNEKTPISSDVKNDRFDDLVDELKKVEEKAYEDIHNSTFSENNSIFSENSTALKTAIGQSVYQYEAVIMMGIAACDAVASTSRVGDELFLNGTTLYTQLLNTKINGLSGNVSCDERTGSRLVL
jgi:nicotinamidase-related amidase